MSFEQSFKNLLPWEGGYSNDPGDDGGPTDLGVIQVEYNAERREEGLPLQSVRNITMAEAEDVYRRKYWQPMACDKLNPGVANAVFDSGVNSGIGRGVQWLQRAINELGGSVAVDGVVGPLTVAAANSTPPDKLIDAMLDLRLAFLHVAHNHEGQALWPLFGHGWASRVAGVRAQSHALASAS